MLINELDDFFNKLDRSYFIDNENKKYADKNIALKIGFEQTISQPALVYRMTRKLDPEKTSKVLEIGTGSGYQTIFLAKFSGMVYTVERIPELSQKANERLKKLGYDNIQFKIGDGSEGWPEHAPYDRIIVTAAAGDIPAPLVEQLSPGGRMLLPVGKKGLQKMTMITKNIDGKIEIDSLEDVVFVELKGKHGWNPVTHSLFKENKSDSIEPFP